MTPHQTRPRHRPRRGVSPPRIGAATGNTAVRTRFFDTADVEGAECSSEPMNNWLNTDHVAQITWYPEEHEFIVKWTTGLSITVSEEQGVRALEELIQSEPHDVPPGPEYL